MYEQPLDGDDVTLAGVEAGGEAVPQRMETPLGRKGLHRDYFQPTRGDMSGVSGGEDPFLKDRCYTHPDEHSDFLSQRDMSVLPPLPVTVGE